MLRASELVVMVDVLAADAAAVVQRATAVGDGARRNARDAAAFQVLSSVQLLSFVVSESGEVDVSAVAADDTLHDPYAAPLL